MFFAFARLPRPLLSAARAWLTRALNGCWSIVARTWPFVTTELKSAISRVIFPETWLPTCTDTTGLTVPVAVTIAVMGPRSTSAVM